MSATGAKGPKGARRAKDAAQAGKVALVRALSKLGYASRSQAYELIRTGRVEVNGRPVTDPALRAHGRTRTPLSHRARPASPDLSSAAWW